MGTSLELLLNLLLTFYQRMDHSEYHSLINPKLQQLGFSSLQSKSNGLIVQVLLIE